MLKQDLADISSQKLLHAKAWAEVYELIDVQLSPLGLGAIKKLGLSAGDTVADIGCGAGQTLLQLAEQVGTEGQVIGVDVAPLLLEIAGQRTKPLSQVRLIQADAESLDLPSESLDVVFSPFGVMSFNDPVSAFTNFRRLLKPSGKLAFSCWRALEDNELDHFPLSAVGIRAKVDETPFSFADPEYIHGILEAAGFEEIVIQSHDEKVSSGDLDAMTSVLLKVGPLGKIIRENPALRATSEPRLRQALAALGDPSVVQLLASVWVVTARTKAAPR
ncbi:class I SAM-dependent methyltransferase [Rhizobium sullae]|uniref:Methyltransferase domain-containing protein n=1 Tax=Rhizobium sullae TaxID=50338 RepID=A0A4R3PRG4_RHISU|nr:methyltransferase domain-containing protein [Rhizobium sullae]TCU02616.1 ubiquinone/menaquinone biosynthesis C-methylase UbiE [Rhizobium sullae]UWU19089.1 methyltransferase domain-containing protein [Rhizobium sullae]